MKKFFKRLRSFLNFFYSLNHYWGCETLTFWEYVYKKRIGFNTAWELAKLIHE